MKHIVFILLSTFLLIKSSQTSNADKSPFTASDMHILNRLSSFTPSLDNKYVVFVNQLWDKESTKYYTNLQYLESPEFAKKNCENSVDAANVTIPVLGQSDYNPVFSSEFPDLLFFIRTKDGSSQLYYIDFPPSENSEPTQLTNYVLDIGNVIFVKNTLVFSTDVYYDCEDFDCTKKRDDEVAARGENTYSIYTKLMMRHWDIWYTEGKASHPFYQKVVKENNLPKLEKDPVDLLKTKVYCSPPIENGAEQFSISADGNLIAFSAHSKDEKMSYNTKWDIFIYDISKIELKEITSDEKGRCQNPIFKPDDDTENKLAYLCMLNYGLESDRLSLRIYNPSTSQYESENNEITITINSYIWDTSAEKKFILNVVDEGRIKLYSFDFTKEKTTAYTNLTNDNNAYGDPLIISSDLSSILISYSSFTRANLLSILTKDTTTNLYTSKVYYDANADFMENFEMMDAEWFTFTGANNDRIQGWLMKPVNFDSTKKYPLAYLIHGGPEGAWDPLWSYRWNPNLWASHGYVVLMINPHGSSGMGMDFQNAVRYNWGGWPYEDIMKGLDYVLANYDYIDGDRVGGCGASYGGYMVNWIQGHNDEKKFKCLVTHDGVFSTITMFYATEEMWFPMSEYCPHDQWGCKPYNDDERKGYEEYNPEYFAQNWNTPHLIIHGSKDYRIPVTEGISAFTTLQIRGVPSRFLHFPDENHWVLKPSNSIKWYEEVLGWLDKYLDNE